MTKLCDIIEKRSGDRYWYENGNTPGSFTPEQLEEIRKSTMAKILCDNGDNLRSVQPRAFILKDPFLWATFRLNFIPLKTCRHFASKRFYSRNELTECSAFLNGAMDLTLWKERKNGSQVNNFGWCPTSEFVRFTIHFLSTRLFIVVWSVVACLGLSTDINVSQGPHHQDYQQIVHIFSRIFSMYIHRCKNNYKKRRKLCVNKCANLHRMTEYHFFYSFLIPQSVWWPITWNCKGRTIFMNLVRGSPKFW